MFREKEKEVVEETDLEVEEGKEPEGFEKKEAQVA